MTKMNLRFLLLCVFALPAIGDCAEPAQVYQKTIADINPRLTLKQWGLAYCVAEHVEGRTAQGSAAMGGYFQLGGHESEDAYRNVRRFFDEWVAQHPAVPKTAGTDLSLMTCINAYESAEYGQVVREQDR